MAMTMTSTIDELVYGVNESNVVEARCDELLEDMPGQPDVYRLLSKPPQRDEVVYMPGMGKLRVAGVAEDGVLCTLFMKDSQQPSGQDSEVDDGEE